MGFSPEHSTSIGRILNHRTGYVSPQFHVVYDDLFTSVPNTETGGNADDEVMTVAQWEKLLTFGCERYVDEDNPKNQPSLHRDWLTQQENQARDQLREERRQSNDQPLTIPTPPSEGADVDEVEVTQVSEDVAVIDLQ